MNVPNKVKQLKSIQAKGKQNVPVYIITPLIGNKLDDYQSDWKGQ